VITPVTAVTAVMDATDVLLFKDTFFAFLFFYFLRGEDI
jgi:hypothetical protein